MKVWIVAVGEPLPIEQSNERLLRAGILSNMLVARGHQVTWWTSTFLHMKKRHLFPSDRVVELESGLRIRLLHGLAYNSNVSIRRLIDHWIVGRKFAREAAREAKPDLILCSFPTIELSREATRYGKREAVPVVLDVRDLWPDIFVALGPKPLQPVLRLLLAPYFLMTRRAIKDASAIVAINEGFVDWGVEKAGRTRTDRDRSFAMGYPNVELSQDAIAAGHEFWKNAGLADETVFKAIFVGNIGRQFEFEPIVEVARRMAGQPVQFIICGTGDLTGMLAGHAKNLPNMLLPGWVGSNEIWTLMRMAHVGLAPYHAEESFTHSLPNKALEYLSAGLPIVASLPGALEDLLDSQQCGLTYQNRSADALEAALRRLIDDPARREQMGRNARAIFELKFSAEHVYSEMIDHLGCLNNVIPVQGTK